MNGPVFTDAFSRTERYEAFLFAFGGIMLEIHLAWKRVIGSRRYAREIAGGTEAVWARIRESEARVITQALDICAERSCSTGALPTAKECLRAIRRAGKKEGYPISHVLLFLVYVRTPLDVMRGLQIQLK